MSMQQMVDSINDHITRLQTRELEKFGEIGEKVENGDSLDDDEREYLEKLADRLGI